MNIELIKREAKAALAYGFSTVQNLTPTAVLQLVSELEGAQFAARQHQNTVKTQARIIAGMPAQQAGVAPGCVCGEPMTLGTVHRADGPCYTAEASTAQEQAASVPAGWKLVPVVPTDDMNDATNLKIGGCYSCSASIPTWAECAEIYADMLAAAPPPPVAPAHALTDAECALALRIAKADTSEWANSLDTEPTSEQTDGYMVRTLVAHLARKG